MAKFEWCASLDIGSSLHPVTKTDLHHAYQALRTRPFATLLMNRLLNAKAPPASPLEVGIDDCMDVQVVKQAKFGRCTESTET